MSKIVETNEKIAEGVTEGMQKIEDGVVGGYKKIEDGVVGGFKKIEDKFTEKFLNEDGTLKTGRVGDADTNCKFFARFVSEISEYRSA